MTRINIRPLKERISGKFPGKTVTNIIRNEPDEMTPEELLAKITTWLNAAEMDREVKQK
jgi:hypothetical protein